MTVSQLPSARLRDARANLKSFIERGRRSTALGPIEFDADVWSHLQVATRLATDGPPVDHKLYFWTGEGGRRGAVGSVPMQSPFKEFVKAFVRLQEEDAPRRFSRHGHTVLVCRELHDHLAEVGYDPCRALPRHFDLAARALRERSTPSGGHQAGSALARIAAAIDRYGIGRVRLGWRNPIPGENFQDRVSDEAARHREAKLPSAAALEALPAIAARVAEPADILLMCVVKLLVSASWRINEVLELPADCEVFESAEEEGTQRQRYGIRYMGSKGAPPRVKWIPSAMIDVARSAIATARELTHQAREDAAWMHARPGRHPFFAGVDPHRLYGMGEANTLLGMSGTSPVLAWLKHNNVPIVQNVPGARAKDCFVAASELERGLLNLIASRNALGRVPLHKALFVIRTHSMHATRNALKGSVERLTSKSVRDFISGCAQTDAIFARFGFTEPDGSPIKVRTHQFRHWLDTLAHEGGLSQELVARWAGRKDMAQNAVYDHVSGVKLAEKVRAMAEAGEMIGPLMRVREALPPQDRVAFMKIQVATGHVTEIGLCIHDWSLVPCAVHGQCADCEEHLIRKGDDRQRREAERQAGEVERLLGAAVAEDSDGTYGASRWAESHRRRLSALRRVVAVHQDASIADGTLVNLDPRQAGRDAASQGGSDVR